MQAQVAAELQPHSPACCSPSTARPMPAETSTAPRQSIGTRRRSSAGLARTRQHERDHRDRHVDPEDRAPRPRQEEAARDRSDRRERAGDPEEDRQRLSALAWRERVDDDRECGGKQQRTERTLQHAEARSATLAPPGPPASRRKAPTPPRTRSLPTITIRRWPTTSVSLPPRANNAARASR